MRTANALAGEQTVQLRGGTYGLALPGDENASANGDLDIAGDLSIFGADRRTTFYINGSHLNANAVVTGDRAIEVLPGATLTLSQLDVFGGMTGGAGAGILVNDGGSLIGRDLEVAGNFSQVEGGGIAAEAKTSVLLRNSSIAGNRSALDGGGIYTEGHAELSNVTVDQNSAYSDGGGLYVAGSASLRFVTVSRNHAALDDPGEGGGLAGPGRIEVASSLLGENRRGNEASSCAGAPTSGGFNIIDDATGCGWIAAPTDMVGTASNPIDLRWRGFVDNGGHSRTHALRRSSPAVDRGGRGCPKDDQRGAPRQRCDAGAYELVLCEGAVVTQVGTEGDDVLKGEKRREVVLARGGDDVIRTGRGKDRICGGPGADRLSAGADRDKITGGAGFDECLGQQGRDRLRGCEAEDREREKKRSR